MRRAGGNCARREWARGRAPAARFTRPRLASTAHFCFCPQGYPLVIVSSVAGCAAPRTRAREDGRPSTYEFMRFERACTADIGAQVLCPTAYESLASDISCTFKSSDLRRGLGAWQPATPLLQIQETLPPHAAKAIVAAWQAAGRWLSRAGRSGSVRRRTPHVESAAPRQPLPAPLRHASRAARAVEHRGKNVGRAQGRRQRSAARCGRCWWDTEVAAGAHRPAHAPGMTCSDLESATDLDGPGEPLRASSQQPCSCVASTCSGVEQRRPRQALLCESYVVALVGVPALMDQESPRPRAKLQPRLQAWPSHKSRARRVA